MAKILENGKKSSSELKMALEADRKERAETAAKEIDEILKKYDCAITATIQVQGDMGKAIPIIVAK